MLNQYLLTTALCAASANLCAAATVEVAVDTNNTIPNVVANSILADGEGVDWTGGVLEVELSSGLIYDAPSLDGAVPQSVFWGILPELEWDTWLGIPGDGTTGIAGCATGICGPTYFYTDTHLLQAWFNTAINDTGVNRIANISLTDDAHGTWSLVVSFQGGAFVQSSGPVINGVMVPEPGMLALMGPGIAGLARRRRHASPKERTTS